MKHIYVVVAVFLCCSYLYYNGVLTAKPLNCFFGVRCTEIQDHNKKIYMNNKFIHEKEILAQFFFLDEAKQVFLRQQSMFDKLDFIEK